MRILLLLCVLLPFSSWADKWVVTKDTDPMDGSTVIMAISPPGTPVRALPFPYTDTQAALVFRCSDSLMPMIVFVGPFHFNGDRTATGSQKVVRMKWGDKLENRAVFGAGSTDSLYIIPTKELVDHVKTANSYRVELPLYGHGSVYFDISLAGSSSAMDEVLEQCSIEGIE